MTECYQGPLWHVAYVEPRAEMDVARDADSELGYEPFVPRERIWTVRRGRKLEIAVPLFPRYVFVQVDPYRQDWQRLLDLEGVIDVLMSSDDVPGYVSHAKIDALRKAEALGVFDRTTKFPSQFEIGEIVRVSDGPFFGLNATIVEFIAKMRSATASKRARILVDFMGRAATTELDVTSLEKL